MSPHPRQCSRLQTLSGTAWMAHTLFFTALWFSAGVPTIEAILVIWGLFAAVGASILVRWPYLEKEGGRKRGVVNVVDYLLDGFCVLSTIPKQVPLLSIVFGRRWSAESLIGTMISRVMSSPLFARGRS